MEPEIGSSSQHRKSFSLLGLLYILVSSVIIDIMSRKHWSKPNIAANAGNKPEHKTTQGERLPPVTPPSAPQCQPTPYHCEITCKAEKTRWDKAKPWVEGGGLILLAVYTGFTVAMYFATHESAKAATSAANTAHDTLVASNRPWIKLDISEAGPLIFDAKGSRMTFHVVATNVGHSPAIQVAEDYKLAPSRPTQVFSQNPLIGIERFCADAEISSRFTGRTFFPGDKGYDWNEVVTMEPIDPKSRYVTPQLIACVAYRADFTDRQFHTGGAWYVVPVKPRMKEHPAMIFIQDKTVSVRVFPDMFEGPSAN